MFYWPGNGFQSQMRPRSINQCKPIQALLAAGGIGMLPPA